MSEILPALRERRARRAFRTEPVPLDVQERLWRAASMAPSQGNAQPARILVTSSGAARERVNAAMNAGNKGWTAPAPLLLAVAANPSHDPPQTNLDGTTREYWAFDTGLAVGNLMAQATAEGLIAHPMGGFDEPAMRDAFGVPAEVRILAIVAVGHPGDPQTLPEDLQAREGGPQRRIPIENIVAYDRWNDAVGRSARELRGPRDGS